MELLIAILVFFGAITPNESGLTPDQFCQMINDNQPLVQYYTENPDQLLAINPTQIIDNMLALLKRNK